MSIPEGSGWGKNENENALIGSKGGNINKILKDWILLGIIFLTGTLCFGLGLLAAKENSVKGKEGDGLWIEQLPKEEVVDMSAAGSRTSDSAVIPPSTAPVSAAPIISQPAAAAAANTAGPSTGKYVASKTGTKYYLPTCGTAKRIKDENKVWFATKEDAEKAGYEPGSTCKGL
jgi:hypothetical protein